MAFLTANRLRETFREFRELHGVLFSAFDDTFIALLVPHFAVIGLPPVSHAHSGSGQKQTVILRCGDGSIEGF